MTRKMNSTKEGRSLGGFAPAVRGSGIPVVILALVVLNCRSPLEKQLDAGERALGRGRYREAIAHYSEVILQAPGSEQAAEALYEMAVIYYLQRRNPDAARASIRKILHEHPESAVAHDARAMLARLYAEDLKEPEKAILEYRQLLEDARDEKEKRDILLSIADCRYQQDDLVAAAEDYRFIIEEISYGEESDRAFLRLAYIEALLGRWDEALDALDALLVATDSPQSRREAFLARAEIHLRTNRRPQARVSLASADREFPDDPVLVDLGTRLAWLEREAKSLDDGASESQILLEELQRNISWGRGRRTQRSSR
jgi:tetratricopeptide (TPR) repeat protein